MSIIQWSPPTESGWIWTLANGSSWRCEILSLHPFYTSRQGYKYVPGHHLATWTVMG